jgi:KaiC/GvpD/RAD55 family RecA-like ATPase
MSDEVDSGRLVIRAYKGRSSTGINGLDLALEGGFIPGSSILIIGSATSGIDRFVRQFWSISPDKRSFYMIDGYLEEGMIDAKTMPSMDIFQATKSKGIVIDSLSTLILKEGIDQVLSGISSCRQAVQDSHDHSFFTLYHGLHERYHEILLIRLCDVVIELHEEIRGNEIIRMLEVKKIAGMQPPGRVLPFIMTEKGIELSTTSRVV